MTETRVHVPGAKLGWLRATQLAFDDPESGCVERADHLWSYDFVHHRADDDRAFSDDQTACRNIPAPQGVGPKGVGQRTGFAGGPIRAGGATRPNFRQAKRPALAGPGPLGSGKALARWRANECSHPFHQTPAGVGGSIPTQAARSGEAVAIIPGLWLTTPIRPTHAGRRAVCD